jgi:HAE1 family hydrophobic/amphiphilic exporter-1
MNPAKFSIAKPVTILMASLAVLVLGATSFMQLKTDLLPDITFPVIAIITSYPGTPPEEIEEFVSKPLEEAAATVADYKSVRSISRESVSIVIVDFDWGRDMDWAAFDTREKVDPVIERLPTGVRRPVIMKLDPGTLMPVLTINVTGMEDMKRLRQIAEDDIKPELEKLPGVAAANVYGGLQREIQVEVDRGRLQAHGLSVAQIEGALQRANVNIPTGFTTEGPKEYTIRLVGQFQSVEEIGDLVIADRGGVPIYLRNIATVLDTHAEVRSYARVNGDPCVSLSIVKESIANTVEVSQAVQDAVSTLPDKLPLGLEMTITHNQADFIEASLDNLYSVAIEGAVLALLIIFVFLATFRGTLIGGISIPLSLLATFALMYFSDMTLNIVTMGGLVLAIGRLVDDSVVVLENIYRHVEEGEPVVDAAINGTGELSMAIFAVTLATMCVFFPVMYVGGLISTLFTPMSMVVIFGLPLDIPACYGYRASPKRYRLPIAPVSRVIVRSVAPAKAHDDAAAVWRAAVCVQIYRADLHRRLDVIVRLSGHVYHLGHDEPTTPVPTQCQTHDVLALGIAGRAKIVHLKAQAAVGTLGAGVLRTV